MSKLVAVAYIPVLHRGYIDLVQQLEQEGVESLYLVGDDILGKHEELDYINRKDRLRALTTAELIFSITALSSLRVVELDEAVALELQPEKIITPREDISELVVATYFSGADVDYRPVFLRRDKHSVGDDVPATSENTVPASDFGKTVWQGVLSEAEKSADWYRRVGAALVKEGEVVFVTHNEHMPEEQLPNIEGDARALFKKGIHINYVTAAHAEVAAIGAAARAGIVTEGAELYVTDFPCPYCARLIAKAGISKVYFLRGYAALEGDAFLREVGVELVQVTLD